MTASEAAGESIRRAKSRAVEATLVEATLEGFVHGFNLLAEGGEGDFAKVANILGSYTFKAFCQSSGKAMQAHAI